MTKIRWLTDLFICTLLFHSAWACALTDDTGALVTAAKPGVRVISLLPSLTETVCLLNRCNVLVGVDRYSNWPFAIKALPKVGGGLDPNIEAITQLKPDLILTASSSKAADRLRALGFRVVALEPKNYADVQRTIRIIALLLGIPDAVAQQAWQQIEADIATTAASVPPSVRGARIYFEVSQVPHAAGAASFIGQTLIRLGAQNIVPPALGEFPQINPEFVVRANPDVILVADTNFTGMDRRPGWSNIRALREHRVCVYNREQADMLVRAGPRLAEGAALMARCLISKAPRTGEAAISTQVF